MPRYFLELAYDGSQYGGFQIQKNAHTIQAEATRALEVFYKQSFVLTGSSRTDTGVHALQNFFHFDTVIPLRDPQKCVYNLNALLPADIAITNLYQVDDEAHCRFDALSREYHYYIYQKKNPFLNGRAYYYPYLLNLEWLNTAATVLIRHKNFTSFSKRNTQVKNFNCDMMVSQWTIEREQIIYKVKANRFLRGMVKALVGTMLHAGKGKISVDEFERIIMAKNCSKADFSVPSHGLYLAKVDMKPIN